MTCYTLVFTDYTKFTLYAENTIIADIGAKRSNPGKVVRYTRLATREEEQSLWPTPPVGIGNDLLTATKTIPTSGQFVVVWTFNHCAWCGTYRFNEYGDLTRYNETADEFEDEGGSLHHQPWFMNSRATFFVHTS